MEKGFRSKMTWLHTWTGLVVGWLLFAIFVTGTSSYYRNEITLWMQPELHKSIESEKSLDIAIEEAIKESEKKTNIFVTLPNSRNNVISIKDHSFLTKKPKSANGDARKSDSQGHGHGGAETKQEKASGKFGNTKDKSKFKKRKKRKPPTYIDATTGEILKPVDTGGGDFLYRFHFQLYSIPRDTAEWIVGIATMFMFIAIITGVIIHKRIFKDIFTFRPKNNPRGWMDAHILPAVAALPFYVMITYSGLVLLTNTVMPWAVQTYYKDYRSYKDAISDTRDKELALIHKKQMQINSSSTSRPSNTLYRYLNTNSQKAISRHKTLHTQRIMNSRAKRVFTQKNVKLRGPYLYKDKLKDILKKANTYFPSGVGSFSIAKDLINNRVFLIVNPKDSSSIFTFKRDLEAVTFDAKTGEFISTTPPSVSNSTVINTNNALATLHMANFADSFLRFIFFVAGASGIILVGTGLILWSEKRKKKNERKMSFGFWLVEKLNLGTIVGIFIAIAAYFIANRVIPFDYVTRAELEISTFFVVWLLSYVYAFIRDTKKAWKEQLFIGTLLFVSLPIINAFRVFTSPSDIFYRDSIFIGFDIFFIFMAGVFALIRFILIRKERKGEQK